MVPTVSGPALSPPRTPTATPRHCGHYTHTQPCPPPLISHPNVSRRARVCSLAPGQVTTHPAPPTTSHLQPKREPARSRLVPSTRPCHNTPGPAHHLPSRPHHHAPLTSHLPRQHHPRRPCRPLQRLHQVPRHPAGPPLLTPPERTVAPRDGSPPRSRGQPHPGNVR
jgi:hypothetical protein